jgi:hypothetical protein
LAAVLLGLTLGLESPALAGPVDRLCPALANQAERGQGIPRGLLHAVALAESGRWIADERATRPWPWTVRSGEDSFYLPSKAAALRKVEELQRAGRSNIDVGCMQINLGYHGHEFASVAEALEPARNVAYGARFLKRLQEETQSWASATARYHSRHPDRGWVYREKVFRLWDELLRRPDARQPIRLAGAPLEITPDVVAEAAEALEPTRVINPGAGAAGRRGAPRILRGN